MLGRFDSFIRHVKEKKTEAQKAWDKFNKKQGRRARRNVKWQKKGHSRDYPWWQFWIR
jgi:hypothetical protein